MSEEQDTKTNTKDTVKTDTLPVTNKLELLPSASGQDSDEDNNNNEDNKVNDNNNDDANNDISISKESTKKSKSGIKQHSLSKDETLRKYLPYYEEFHARKEKSVLKMKDYANDPQGYLQAILTKYTIDHPKDITIQQSQGTNNNENNENNENNNIDNDTKESGFSPSNDSIDSKHVLNESSESNELRPWIEGAMEKMMPQPGVFGRVRYKSRLFRLFDEALIWFDDPNILSKWINRNELTMRPLGVLPLAMITALRTVDMTKSDSDISEDDLLKLELQIGDEGVIVLRCADFRQRIKWFECLHCAIFSVDRPLFTQKEGLWRIGEETAESDKQMTTQQISEKEEANRKLRHVHVRMGTSLVLTVQKLRRQLSTTNAIDPKILDTINDEDGILDDEEKLDGLSDDENDNENKNKNKIEKENNNDKINNTDNTTNMDQTNKNENTNELKNDIKNDKKNVSENSDQQNNDNQNLTPTNIDKSNETRNKSNSSSEDANENYPLAPDKLNGDSSGNVEMKSIGKSKPNIDVSAATDESSPKHKNRKIL